MVLAESRLYPKSIKRVVSPLMNVLILGTKNDIANLSPALVVNLLSSEL